MLEYVIFPEMESRSSQFRIEYSNAQLLGKKVGAYLICEENKQDIFF